MIDRASKDLHDVDPVIDEVRDPEVAADQLLLGPLPAEPDTRLVHSGTPKEILLVKPLPREGFCSVAGLRDDPDVAVECPHQGSNHLNRVMMRRRRQKLIGDLGISPARSIDHGDDHSSKINAETDSFTHRDVPHICFAELTAHLPRAARL
jgi:hypothetical protein